MLVIHCVAMYVRQFTLKKSAQSRLPILTAEICPITILLPMSTLISVKCSMCIQKAYRKNAESTGHSISHSVMASEIKVLLLL